MKWYVTVERVDDDSPERPPAARQGVSNELMLAAHDPASIIGMAAELAYQRLLWKLEEEGR
jgi:hypothetical protein